MESHQRDHENYVACLRSHRRRAKALLDFERHDDDELGFRKNDIITVRGAAPAGQEVAPPAGPRPRATTPLRASVGWQGGQMVSQELGPGIQGLTSSSFPPRRSFLRRMSTAGSGN